MVFKQFRTTDCLPFLYILVGQWRADPLNCFNILPLLLPTNQREKNEIQWMAPGWFGSHSPVIINNETTISSKTTKNMYPEQRHSPGKRVSRTTVRMGSKQH